VRVMQDVCKIPAIRELWQELLLQPTRTSPVVPLTQLLTKRTPPKFLQSRISPDLETHILFVLKNVRSRA